MKLIFTEEDQGSTMKVIVDPVTSRIFMTRPTKGLTPKLREFAEAMSSLASDGGQRMFLEFVAQTEQRKVLIGKEMCG